MPAMLIAVTLGLMRLQSVGDRLPLYRHCTNRCTRQCREAFKHDPKATDSNSATDRDLGAQGDMNVDPAHHSTVVWDRLLWSCPAQCQYRCMWRVEGWRRERGQSPVQYHGKWPFVRVLGLQEPLSVVFSIANLAAQGQGLANYHKETNALAEANNGMVTAHWSTMVSMWHVHGLLMVLAWTCAAVFHTRDTPVTERLDYFTATAGIMSAVTASVIRMLPHSAPRWLGQAFGVVTVAGFVAYTHAMNAATRFDYGFHGTFNATWVLAMVPLWCGWWLVYRHGHGHAWKAVLFSISVPVCAAAELGDFPPLADALDAHALWHALTVPLACLWWSFLVDDARFEIATARRKCD
eukprot:m.222011 g.222011  ORF g.222011 m.222011 type:complete len:351 (+) comp32272_c0_seq1:349-1401(+)